MLVSSICACIGQLMWKLSAEQGLIIMLLGFCFYGAGALVMISAYRFGKLSVLQPRPQWGQTPMWSLKSTEALFVKYNYPNIHDNEQSDFFSELKILLLKSKGSLFSNLITNARWLYDYLVCVIDSGKKKELTFLQNNEEGVLIKHYADWYLHQAMLFPKSVHIFDKTHQISNILKDIEIYIDSEHLTPIDNYEFKDSKDDIGIQLSDVICGIYGQLYSYFNKKTDADILRDIDRMNDTQLECLLLLSRLQLEADNENRGYFYYTVPYSFLGRVTSCFQYIEGILHTT